MVTIMQRPTRVSMMLVRLIVMVAAIAVIMRRSMIMMMRDFGMNVEVRAVITMVPVPDRALGGRGAGIDPQAISMA